jgi:hypothetical protein
MARPDDTTSGGYQGDSSDTGTGDKGGTGTGSGDGGTYPKYTVRFHGKLVPESPVSSRPPYLCAAGNERQGDPRAEPHPANPDEPDLTITIEEHQ